MNIAEDIFKMHNKFRVPQWLDESSPSTRQGLMKLRMRMLTEEFAETMDAYLQSDPEEMIDGLIDLIVIATGTLDIAGVNVESAWNEVLRANVAKQVGIKPGRPNPLGLPDLIKPEGWTGPDHSKNHGLLKDMI